jgi:hypothetical protein
VQGPLLTFAQVRKVLIDRYKCTVETIPAGMGMDGDGEPSPPIYAFYRETEGDGVLMSTIVVRHDDAPILPSNLRSFLARLALTPDDLQLLF